MDKMAVYLVGDHHMGMLSWAPETGANYDLEIGERLLVGAFDYLTANVPASPKAAIVFLGDFKHYDSYKPVTPASGHILDADSRFPAMVQATIRCKRAAINAALRRHHHVLVIDELGNHDESGSVIDREWLSVVYENEPRVTVDTSPRHFHYFRHGRTLVGVHHGHGAKPEQLQGIMSADCPAEWGDTTYRYWYTGHVHSKRQWDYPGCSVESFRILPPNDAWAFNKGYRSHRGMEAIVLSEKFGEVLRVPFKPEMLDQCSHTI
jgi:hypothetical protein